MKFRKEGHWKHDKMIEGRLITLKRTGEQLYQTVTCQEGKWDYLGHPLGEMRIQENGRVRTKIALPGVTRYLPNWGIFREAIEKSIWQFEGEISEVPEGFGKAICYDGTLIEGWFLDGQVDESKPCTVTYSDGTVQKGLWQNGRVASSEPRDEG